MSIARCLRPAVLSDAERVRFSARVEAETKDVAAANTELAARMKKALVEARDRGYTRPGAGK